ncbi:MAG TPA: Rrf2 family transcriptional regulator [Candidatus Acidoferrum sp.]|nr:Rrf2 family transcriptional regulator [Candidatus Acidoferrum sp.]
MKVYTPKRMRVSAKGEYATRAVLHLAMEYPEVVTIHQIAARQKIPVKYLEQILLELRRGGVVSSRRGVHGGYLLARPPMEVSVGEVLQVVDNRVIESSCYQQDSDRGFACSDPVTCGLKQVWRDVRQAVDKILFETSFADVCTRSSTKLPGANASETLARLSL